MGEKEVTSLKETRKWYTEEFGGKKGKEKCNYNFFHNKRLKKGEL